MITPKRGLKSAAMAALMDEIDSKMSSLRRGFNPGERVNGCVISVGRDYVVLDVNSTYQGIVDVSQWDGLELPKQGEIIPVYFVDIKEGSARFVIKSDSTSSSVESINQAYLSKLPIEGRFDKVVNGGYEVNVAGQRTFCPFSQVSLKRGASDEEWIGKTQTFLVIEFDPQEHTIVVSHRALEEQERAQKREALREQLEVGDKVEGVVTKIMPFGAFVDIDGIEGLIPLRQLSWDKKIRVEDVVSEGQKVFVTIDSLDWENNRFSFSLRSDSEDPWKLFEAEYEVGSYVTGKVVKVMSYGLFVELDCGVEGFVHISKLGIKQKITSLVTKFTEGQILNLKIDSIDYEQRKIALSVDNREEEEKEFENERKQKEEREEIEKLLKASSNKNSSFGSFGDMLSEAFKK